MRLHGNGHDVEIIFRLIGLVVRTLLLLAHLFVVECGNTGKDLAFEEFEGGTSSGGNVAHVSGTSRLFRGGDRVTSTNNRHGATLLGQVGQNVNESKGSLGKGFHFEDTHGSVHNDRLAVRQGRLLLLRRLGAIVKSHPAIRNLISGDNLGVGIC